MVAIAALAFVGIFVFAVPFPIIIATAATLGLIGKAVGLTDFQGSPRTSCLSTQAEQPAAIDGAFARQFPDMSGPRCARLVKVAVIGLTIWLGPILILWLTLGSENVFTTLATFNSRMAVVTFGGAYAVLAYMAQQAVEHYHWLKPQEMLVGLGFAETTPGPLVSVVQFVGFMAAFRQPGGLSPTLAGTLGGLVAQWATLVPSFYGFSWAGHTSRHCAQIKR